MAGTYELHWDNAANRLEFKLVGQFDDAGYEAWEAALRAAVAKAPAAGWTMLGDVTQFPPQHAVITKRFEETIKFIFAHGASKNAIIAPKTVVAMQARRLTSNVGVADQVTFVATRQEALDWLAGTSTRSLR